VYRRHSSLQGSSRRFLALRSIDRKKTPSAFAEEADRANMSIAQPQQSNNYNHLRNGFSSRLRRIQVCSNTYEWTSNVGGGFTWHRRHISSYGCNCLIYEQCFDSWPRLTMRTEHTAHPFLVRKPTGLHTI
jgi:hypothetical protein